MLNLLRLQTYKSRDLLHPIICILYCKMSVASCQSIDLESCFKCNSCFAAFPSLNGLKDHYRTDWHVFNTKRRSNNLPALKRDLFMTLLKQRQQEKSTPAASSASQSLPTVFNSVDTEMATDQATEGEGSNDFEDIDEDEPEEIEVSGKMSIFDEKTFATVEENVQYMSLSYGFFIPDSEFLEDLNGLIEFLNEKVRIGYTCLYCQRSFNSTKSCQQHMISLSHCKIAYEEGVDLDDIGDFYDFTATYEGRDDMEVDENGEIINADQELQITSAGDLQLPNGLLLGHRAFRRYFKQKYRPPVENEALLAAQREELLRLQTKFGALALPSSTDQKQSVELMSDVQVLSALVRYHKQVRKGQMIEQRYRLREMSKSQRREYQSTQDQQRSHETTTAKIRDYHGMLK